MEAQEYILRGDISWLIMMIVIARLMMMMRCRLMMTISKLTETMSSPALFICSIDTHVFITQIHVHVNLIFQGVNFDLRIRVFQELEYDYDEDDPAWLTYDSEFGF